jgi:hypothetical protein
VPFLHFEVYGFCTDILFYNFCIDFIKISWYCKFVIWTFQKQKHNDDDDDINIPNDVSEAPIDNNTMNLDPKSNYCN